MRPSTCQALEDYARRFLGDLPWRIRWDVDAHRYSLSIGRLAPVLIGRTRVAAETWIEAHAAKDNAQP